MHPQERVDEYVGRGWWTDETVQQMLLDRVAQRGDALAVVDAPNKAELVDIAPLRLSWNELDAKVDELAAVLLAHGVGEGDVIALQLPNSPSLITVLHHGPTEADPERLHHRP